MPGLELIEWDYDIFFFLLLLFLWGGVHVCVKLADMLTFQPIYHPK